jgi:N-acetylglucosaminyldiphosphoundecaprenol N-acetyl-beta-D-mannosaminyltransferase
MLNVCGSDFFFSYHTAFFVPEIPRAVSKSGKIRVLGINFHNEGVYCAVDHIRSGGLMVVPSGPGLESIPYDAPYYEALLSADLVLPDSGFMAVIWNITHRDKINRVSGLEFLRVFFADPDVKKSQCILLVDPRPSESESNKLFLTKLGFTAHGQTTYIAPSYDRCKVEDPALLDIIEQKRPEYVLINLGGGIQEKLGWYLRRNLSYAPGIICTGAAIAFLTGHQISIPSWADKMYLGWLFRIFQHPVRFGPRYWKAVGLSRLLFRYGADRPTLSGQMESS